MQSHTPASFSFIASRLANINIRLNTGLSLHSFGYWYFLFDTFRHTSPGCIDTGGFKPLLHIQPANTGYCRLILPKAPGIFFAACQPPVSQPRRARYTEADVAYFRWDFPEISPFRGQSGFAAVISANNGQEGFAGFRFGCRLKATASSLASFSWDCQPIFWMGIFVRLRQYNISESQLSTGRCK